MTTVLYCVRCDWELDITAAGCANRCAVCGAHGLRYVSFDPLTEGAEAEAVKLRNRELAA